jgi:heptosyltransferase-1
VRYLIIKTSSFGDVVQAFGVLNYLKKRVPEARVDWVVEKKMAALVRAHPLVNKTIELGAKEWKQNLLNPHTYQQVQEFIKNLREYSYDAVFDLQGNTKSGCVTFLTKARTKVGFGWKTVAEWPNCLATGLRINPPVGQNIRRDYLYLVQSYFRDFSSLPDEKVELRLDPSEKALLGQYLDLLQTCPWMISAGSNWENKQLAFSSLKRFLFLAQKTFHPFFLFTAGNAEEFEMASMCSKLFPHSIICHKLPLPVLQHLMGKMKLVVTMDALPLHLAATTNVPTVSFFGPSLGCKYRPPGERHLSFQGHCPRGSSFEKRCPRLRSCRTAACIHDIDIDLAFASFAEWWAELV